VASLTVAGLLSMSGPLPSSDTEDTTQMPPDLEQERTRRIDRFDLWLFLSVWIVITAAAGLGIALS